MHPKLISLESSCDEIWRNHIPESVSVTSTTATISYKENWTWNLDSDVARSSKDIQRIKLKPNTQLSSTGRLVTKWSEETLERTKFKATLLVERNMIMSQIKRVRGDLSRWIKKEEHNIDFSLSGLSHSVVKEAEHLRILIEKDFKPICIRMSTNHSATIRRRWSANWAMWSYSSCAKQYQKYKVLTVFFIGIKELCRTLADNAWFAANPEESFMNEDRMHSPSRTTWSRKAPPMVLDTARPKYKKKYQMAWNAWERWCKKVDSQGYMVQVFTIDSSEIQCIVNHNSQSDVQN